jgi:hypothetical protein
MEDLGPQTFWDEQIHPVSAGEKKVDRPNAILSLLSTEYLILSRYPSLFFSFVWDSW